MPSDMVRFILDRANAPQLTAEELARLDAMTDAQITTAAESDPDNPPLTAAELDRMEAVRRARRG